MSRSPFGRYFNANFGIMQLEGKVKKKERKEAFAKQAIETMNKIKEEYSL